MHVLCGCFASFVQCAVFCVFCVYFCAYWDNWDKLGQLEIVPGDKTEEGVGQMGQSRGYRL